MRMIDGLLGGISFTALLMASTTLPAATIKSVEFVGMEAPKPPLT